MLAPELRVMRRLLKSSLFRLTSKSVPVNSAYEVWSASRSLPTGEILVPGAHRTVSLLNIRLAAIIVSTCAFDFFSHIWSLHPLRTTLMLSLNVVRSVLPAFRGYSQALIIDQLQQLVTSGDFTWSRLINFLMTDVAREVGRRILEGVLETYASVFTTISTPAYMNLCRTSNETIVMDSAKFFVEYAQLEHRVRLDIPTLQDPQIRDLLAESDLFARSFSGSGSFGLLSPLDCIHIISLATEIFSHLLLILSLTGGPVHFWVLLLSLFSVTLPILLTWIRCPEVHSDDTFTPREARAADRQEKMRNLAYDEGHRPEIELFGLGDWILKTWASARKVVLDSEHSRQLQESSILSNLNFSDFFFAVQNIPLVLLLQTSSASLGSLTLYRSSIQSVILASKGLVATCRMVFQGIFLMSAFCAAKDVKPQLQPTEEDAVCYQPCPEGARIEARGLSYTYPGCPEPALKNVNFSLRSGETLAIVGHNGSGKSTLAKVLLRIVDCEGDLIVNGTSIRRYDPFDFHQHMSGVFQNFSKFNSTVRENVGFGRVEKMSSRTTIESAIQLAEAQSLLNSLPYGLRTVLETPGFMQYTGCSPVRQHGLSGGEWQRLSLARAFMRANEPQVDLLLFDEPTASLDALAQSLIFDTIDRISRSPTTGTRTKTVILITHRLSLARRADRVALMENGTITEFGSHEDLLQKDGAYAALYRASL
ncbi:ABC transporter domain-containing protein [Mycena indigotica]|uniref:ABC transporter domain-containing protein n=1 Tax=Mycena indigotica TaxID=2126181 RepID=A0A8H6SMH5_9AGAR|nr:ABC transporter domain-containing protein [Mycena indigotica]KAF7301537.1 ABC transporter domain-containing protein [Mycena indigotica]